MMELTSFEQVTRLTAMLNAACAQRDQANNAFLTATAEIAMKDVEIARLQAQIKPEAETPPATKSVKKAA